MPHAPELHGSIWTLVALVCAVACLALASLPVGGDAGCTVHYTKGVTNVLAGCPDVQCEDEVDPVDCEEVTWFVDGAKYLGCSCGPAVGDPPRPNLDPDAPCHAETPGPGKGETQPGVRVGAGGQILEPWDCVTQDCPQNEVCHVEDGTGPGPHPACTCQ